MALCIWCDLITEVAWPQSEFDSTVSSVLSRIATLILSKKPDYAVYPFNTVKDESSQHNRLSC